MDEQHALHHFDKEQHDIVMNVNTLECWCYACDNDVLPAANFNQLIQEAQTVLGKILKPDAMVSPMELSSPVAAATVGVETRSFTKRNSSVSMENESSMMTRSSKVPGLVNLGNTCFFNSVIQCISRTVPLLKGIPTTSIPTKALLTKPFFNVLQQLSSSSPSSSTINPTELFGAICRKWKAYKSLRQQDSHELLRRLLDGVRDELQGDQSDKSSSLSKAKPETLIDQVFGGRLVSIIVCDECHHVSFSYESFLDVSLPIFLNGTDSTSSPRFPKGLTSPKRRKSRQASASSIKASPQSKRPKPSFSPIHSPENSMLLEPSMSTSNSTDGFATPTSMHSHRLPSPNNERVLRSMASNVSASQLSGGEDVVDDIKQKMVRMRIEGSDKEDSGHVDGNKAQRRSTRRKSSSRRDQSATLTESENEGTGSAQMQIDTDLSGNAHEEIEDVGGEDIAQKNPFSPRIGKLLRHLSVEDLHSPITPTASFTQHQTKHLVNCLAEFMSVETLEGDNARRCEECFKKRYGCSQEEMKKKLLADQAKKVTESTEDTWETMTESTSEHELPPTQPAEKEEEEEEEVAPTKRTTRSSVSSMIRKVMTPPFLRSSSTTSTTTSISTTVTTFPSAGSSNPSVELNVPMLPLSKAYKRYLLQDLPNVLVLHLKRFQQVGLFGRVQKVEEWIPFERHLDLSMFMNLNAEDNITLNDKDRVVASENEPVMYSLCGVVVHSGSLGGGHYTAYIRVPSGSSTNESDEGRWVYTSDTMTRHVEWDEVKRAQAYILFYEREGGKQIKEF